MIDGALEHSIRGEVEGALISADVEPDGTDLMGASVETDVATSACDHSARLGSGGMASLDTLLGGGRQSRQFHTKVDFCLFLSTVRARPGSPQWSEPNCPPSAVQNPMLDKCAKSAF